MNNKNLTVDEIFNGTHDALNRMKRAHERGTGCHLTREMIASLSVSTIGDLWSQEDPRLPAEEGGKS